MADETQGAEQATAEVKPPEGKKSFMDGQFVNMSGCGFFLICTLVPGIALLLGIVGLIACRDAKARERATMMSLVGGIWFAICVVILSIKLSAG